MIFTNEIKVHLESTNASDLAVARAAWVSNHGEDARQKDGDRVAGLIKFLYRNKHMSPFEHGQFVFFVDCPIFVAREFMRHRTFSYNEVSARYAELQPKFYFPSLDRPLQQTGKIGEYEFTPGTDAQYKMVGKWVARSYKISWLAYRVMKRMGVANEVARIVLPVGIYTQFYATVNPRNLMHFISLRSDPTALEEIRVVAEAMELILAAEMPLTHAAFREYSE